MVLSNYTLTPWQQVRYHVAFSLIYAVSLLPLRVL